MARPSGFQDVNIRKFKGLNLRGAEELYDINQLSVLQNMEVGLAGELKKRPGFAQAHDGSQLGAGNSPLILGQLISNTKNNLIAQSDQSAGKIYVSGNGGLSWVQVSTPAATNYSLTPGFQYLGSYWMGSQNGWFAWTTAGTWVTGAPGLNTVFPIVFAQFRMFYIDNATGNIKFSEPGDFSTGTGFPAANSIGLVGDGSTISGLLPYRDRIVIFTTIGIWILYMNGPPASWSLKKMPYNVSANGPQSFKVVDDLIYFIGSDGVYRSDLTQVQKISLPIQDVFALRADSYKPGSAPLGFITDTLGYWNRRLLCQIRTKNTADGVKLYVFHLDTNSWSEWIPTLASTLGLTFAAATRFQSVTQGWTFPSTDYNKEALYFGAYGGNGKIFRFDDEAISWQDAGANYSARVRTKKLDFDEPGKIKRVLSSSFRIDTTSAVSQYKYVTDGVDRGYVVLPAVADKQKKVKGPGVLRELEVELQDTSNNPFEVHDITVFAKSKSVLTDATM